MHVILSLLYIAESLFGLTGVEVLFLVGIDTTRVFIRVFPETLLSGLPGTFNVTITETNSSPNDCVIIGSPSEAVITIPSPFAP